MIHTPANDCQRVGFEADASNAASITISKALLWLSAKMKFSKISTLEHSQLNCTPWTSSSCRTGEKKSSPRIMVYGRLETSTRRSKDAPRNITVFQEKARIEGERGARELKKQNVLGGWGSRGRVSKKVILSRGSLLRSSRATLNPESPAPRIPTVPTLMFLILMFRVPGFVSSKVPWSTPALSCGLVELSPAPGRDARRG